MPASRRLAHRHRQTRARGLRAGPRRGEHGHAQAGAVPLRCVQGGVAAQGRVLRADDASRCDGKRLVGMPCSEETRRMDSVCRDVRLCTPPRMATTRRFEGAMAGLCRATGSVNLLTEPLQKQNPTEAGCARIGLRVRLVCACGWLQGQPNLGQATPTMLAQAPNLDRSEPRAKSRCLQSRCIPSPTKT